MQYIAVSTPQAGGMQEAGNPPSWPNRARARTTDPVLQCREVARQLTEQQCISDALRPNATGSSRAGSVKTGLFRLISRYFRLGPVCERFQKLRGTARRAAPPPLPYSCIRDLNEHRSDVA